MLWHPKTLQILAMYNVFFIFGRFSIAGKLPKWPKIPFQYPLALRHPKILEKCRKHHRILVSVRNRFWPPPPAKADIATAILTNVIEHLVLLFCPPISTPFTAKAVWAGFSYPNSWPALSFRGARGALSCSRTSFTQSEKGTGKTRRRMARERRGAGSSLVSMETPYYKTIY